MTKKMNSLDTNTRQASAPRGAVKLVAPRHPAYAARGLLGAVALSASAAGVLCAGALLLTPADAAAQDPQPTTKTPNVLLLVDTSGSMEYRSGSTDYPTCDPTGMTTSQRSRWIDLVEVLGGTIPDYRCELIDRKSSDFKSEYELPGSVNPPDADYRNFYVRPLSSTCTVAPNPGGLPAAGSGNAFAWTNLAFREYDTATPCATFTPGSDGLIDSLSDLVRFGLVTFDTLPDESTGHGGGNDPLWSQGVRGAWSYFDTPATGRPAGCLTDQTLEVGVRNGAAPPWEGKMINFGDPDAGTTLNDVRHSQIESVLLSTRPYGATPIAGALDDVRYFLTTDTSPDPLSGSLAAIKSFHGDDWGPSQDPYVQGGCRDQYVILLTDGEPNLDMRPHCGTDCPYDEATTILGDLYSSSIDTYVVGFANETTGSGVDCATMDDSAWDTGGVCLDNPNDAEIQACCSLNEMAYEGSGGARKAYFASDKATLRSSLSEVFSSIVGGSASATQAVRTPKGLADETDAVAYRLLTSYNVVDGASSNVWEGQMERLRFICNDKDEPVEQEKDASLGDDYSFNTSSNPEDRNFVTFTPTTAAEAAGSLRPLMDGANDRDGIGGGGGTMVAGDWKAFPTAIDSASMNVEQTGDCSGSTADECRTLLLQWLVGDDNGMSKERCETPGDADCHVIGDIQHSTPTLVDRPLAIVDDETYTNFATNSAIATRPMMAYTSSNDGFLHGFVVSANTAADRITGSENNEEFAFLPPAVMPFIQSQYPNSRQKLLDGIATTLDVVATHQDDISGYSSTYYPYKLEHPVGAGQSQSGTWRTILLQSFGGSNGGYFAMDVTKPTVASDDASNEGPKLLWQLTTSNSGAKLFGEKAATPLITTVALKNNTSGQIQETAVAVLPGGYGAPSSGSCQRRSVLADVPVQTGYTPRTNVSCYALNPDNDDNTVGPARDPSYMGARSLTIVRLDNGEIIRTFRARLDEAPDLDASKTSSSDYAGTNGLINLAPLDSPITGAPAAFPQGAGLAADRVFVGDQDGTMWRVELSDADPEKWTMGIFFDAFAVHDDVSDPSLSAQIGKPIINPPTLSFDSDGQITMAMATGDQDLSGKADEEQYVWSLTEAVNDDADGFVTEVNWYEELTDGEHVLGPIRLLGEVLYFTTYAPNLLNTFCDNGISRVYGLDYVEIFDSAGGDVSQGGAGALAVLGSTPVRSQTAAELGLPADTLLFGLNVEFTPSCSTVSENETDFLLGGTRRSVTQSTTSTMQLVFQTGHTDTSKSSLGFETGFETVDLESPRTISRIDSWATILD